MPRLSKIGSACLAAFGFGSGAPLVTASYLQVAGGGGGGFVAGGNRGAGGGAGGLLTGTISLNLTESYTVVIGAGGTPLANGSNSTITGTGISVTASVGGGAGGSQNGASSIVGANGGSGGGGVSQSGTGSNAAGTGTAGQGFAGAAGTNDGGQPYGQGGGGGAGALGTLSNNPAGAGGVGLSSSITGTSTFYAGGGGGGSYSGSSGVGGAGGNGGGGTGGGTNGVSTSGTANLGGGGGGAEYSQTSGSSGGSGVVIISYLGAQQFGGGVITSVGGNTIHTFNTSGTLSPLSSLTASYLIVAGGGAGGGQVGGGGGAGGYLTGSGITLDTNSIYAVTVGAGGVGVASSTGGSGTNSTFSMVSTAAVGGGGAGSSNGNTQALNGGSGGGMGGFSALAGGTGTVGQGNNGGGGSAAGAPNYGGGGGGGSSSAGQVPPNGTSVGAGGAGTANSISGSSVTYAAGAISGRYNVGSSNGVAGTANTGNGGSGSSTGGSGAGEVGGNGGSGIVIISYAGSVQQMAGGTVTISGGNVIHTFTSSGYLTPLTLVNNSLRFRASNSAYLSRTPPTAGSRTTWTWSSWVKRGSLGGDRIVFNAGTTGSTDIDIFFSSDQFMISDRSGFNVKTTQVFRDPAAWYHFVVTFDTTQATSTDRIKLYVNGLQITATAGGTSYPAQNATSSINNNVTHRIGTRSLIDNLYDGEITEVNFIDGQALTPNSFGTFNSYGVWQPITYGGSYGTNGFYLPFTNSGNMSANYLVTAGGGGAGESFGAGGGGGGVVSGTTTLNPGSSYTVTVGAGGANQVNTTGGNSSFTGLTTAIGGGCGGGSSFPTGTAGGSGGGGRGGASPAGGGAGTAGQGNAGGNGTSTSAGGGGGAGSAGVTSGNTQGGAGGAGIANPITGSTAGTLVSGTYYLAGGGSGNGIGGAQTPGNGGTASGSAGAANTGAGAGGDGTGSFGGSGIVIISYAGTPKFTGGTITQSGGNTIHTFTTSGILGLGIAADYSPQGNNWTPNNISLTTGSTYDSMTDVPTLTSATAANYCTLNPLNKNSNHTMTDGNLTITSSSYGAASSTIGVSTGKWYHEATITNRTSNNSGAIGFCNELYNIPAELYFPNTTNSFGVSAISGNAASGSEVAYGSAFASGDVIMLAFDADAKKMWVGKNGTWFASGNPVAGTNEFPRTITGNTFFPAVNCFGDTYAYNFGQRPFAYTPPTGFLALNTFNL